MDKQKIDQEKRQDQTFQNLVDEWLSYVGRGWRLMEQTTFAATRNYYEYAIRDREKK